MGTHNKSKSQNSLSRLTIGVMIDDVDSEYQLTIWASIEEVAKVYDVNVICFIGGEIEPPYKFRSNHSTIFQLISPQSVDGLIVVSSVLSTHIGNKKFREYCRRFEPIPMVSFGIELEGISSVVIDNRYGFISVMKHLIEYHGYRKFLFIGGALNNIHAIERYELFIKFLEDHNIPIVPELITFGEFRPARAYEIVNEVMDKNIDFEAIVSANDDMAISAIKALQDRNVELIDNIAVTGYDDTLHSRFQYSLKHVRYQLNLPVMLHLEYNHMNV